MSTQKKSLWRRLTGQKKAHSSPAANANEPHIYYGHWPESFRFLNAASFLRGGAQLKDWDSTKAAPFITELLNSERHRFFQAAMGYLFSAGVEGDYLEFGCFSAVSFRMALTWAKMLSLPPMRFVAFDSFAGLPEVDADVALPSWQAGTMAMSEADFMKTLREHGVGLDRVETIPGFFDATLTDELKAKWIAEGRRASFINVDCDLYSSAIPVFRFIEPFLTEGTVLYVDDWFVGYRGSPEKGVAKAFREFAAQSRFRFQPFLNSGWWGRAWIAYLPAAASDSARDRIL